MLILSNIKMKNKEMNNGFSRKSKYQFLHGSFNPQAVQNLMANMSDKQYRHMSVSMEAGNISS